jgi:conjugal transfer pilus assembly protein TraI
MYPPADGGIPIVSVEELLASQSELLGRLQIAASRLGSEYDTLILQAVRSYAAFVGLLPSTNAAHHRGAGGLFRVGLEVAFASLQGTGGVLFSANVPTEVRRLHEDRWQVATFLAGLTYELYRAATDMVVRSQDGRTWTPYSVGLLEWASANNVSRTYITWPAKPIASEQTRRQANALLVGKVISPSTTEWLNLPGTPIVPAMLSAIVGTQAIEARTLQQLVDSMHNQTVQRDIATQPSQYGHLSLGTHLEPYIIDAMRRLVRERRWLTNVGEGQTHPRLWNLADGLYLVWSPGAKELIELLKAEGISGVPAEPMSLVEVLHKANVITYTDGALFATIQIIGKESTYEAVRIGTPELIYFGVSDIPEVTNAAIRVGSTGNATPKQVAAAPSTQGMLPLGDVPKPDDPTTLADAATAAIAAVKKGRKLAAKAARNNNPESSTVAFDDDYDELSPAFERELAKLPNASRTFLTSCMEDRRANEKAQLSGPHPKGYAISSAAFKKYGLRDGVAVARELAEAGWLLLGNGEFGSQGRFIDYTIGSNEGKVMVLTQEICKFMVAAPTEGETSE